MTPYLNEMGANTGIPFRCSTSPTPHPSKHPKAYRNIHVQGA